MKKIFMILALILAIFANVNAQTTVESTKIFDNTSVSLTVGDANWLHSHFVGEHGWFKTSAPVVGLRFDKWFTPKVGVELDGEAGFGTLKSHTFVDHSYVGLNGLVNLNNLIHGYRGIPDRVEATVFTGAGWWHAYPGSTGNYMATRHGMQLNINFGKSKESAWQLNVVPSITYLLAGNGFKLQYNAHRAYVELSVGATYKFKTSNGTHNFKFCDKQYMQAEWDELNTIVNSLRARNAELDAMLAHKPTQVEVVREVITSVTNTEYVMPQIQFYVNSARVPVTSMSNVRAMAEVMKNTGGSYTLIGYASEEGESEYNRQLSLRRAEALRDVLIEFGVDSSKISVEGRGASTEWGNKDYNRVVVVSQ